MHLWEAFVEVAFPYITVPTAWKLADMEGFHYALADADAVLVLLRLLTSRSNVFWCRFILSTFAFDVQS